ncbi:hypothetical protein [Pseudoscardovia suis]|uniref:Uncharacterized protein n=1 Tax=Pseudoscardovia suis TaxID=987063 RepID=A0A261ER81_9BIFI|nr:hypothetical protein [Pseudoscardovia suis]OZG49354.1 hypothetical protein PSSU_1555 [Pseudoscardovia suis]PJJ65988.1 hypothetical protein CLV65_1240 [Pseudoscardovia suis]
MTPSMILTELAAVLMVVILLLLVALFVALPVLVVIVIVMSVNIARHRRTGVVSGAQSQTRSLSWVMNAMLIDLLVLLVLAAVIWLPPLAGRTWCRSESPDGAYAVTVDKMTSLPATWDGVPVTVTMTHAVDGGRTEKASFQAVMEDTDTIHYECVVTWQPDHVAIGSRAKNPDSFDDAGAVTFFHVYWDDVEFS